MKKTNQRLFFQNVQPDILTKLKQHLGSDVSTINALGELLQGKKNQLDLPTTPMTLISCFNFRRKKNQRFRFIYRRKKNQQFRFVYRRKKN